MTISPIDRETFDRYAPARGPMLGMFASEKGWFADSSRQIIGTILFDHSDKDWNYVILGPDGAGNFRWIAGESSFKDWETAEAEIVRAMSGIERSGKATEELARPDPTITSSDETRILFTDINEELKRYFAQHPEKLYSLSPRKFEELIASIMGDFGFDVELTQATRDGGRDVIAYLRNAVCAYLTYVECKKFAPNKKVGVGIVREVAGVHYLRRPAKSLIVTTSFFTKNAVEEARKIEHQLELKDYDALKVWLRERDAVRHAN